MYLPILAHRIHCGLWRGQQATDGIREPAGVRRDTAVRIREPRHWEFMPDSLIHLHSIRSPMTNKISFVLSVISIALLQACGGGGGSTNSVNVSSTGSAGTSTGSVSATFNRSATARYHLTSTGGQLFGRLDNSVQETNGAMTTLGSSVLSGDKVVKEISGDASYALGRWTAGTVTTSSGAATLTGTDNKAYHYIAFNVPNAFPASGSLTCDAGAFTAPTYVGGGVATGAGSGTGTGAFDSGTASGSATLTFGADGAAVGGNISVAASGSSGSISLKTSGMTPNGSSITGAYLSNGAGAYLQVGDAGTGAYLVVGSYAVSLANGARYIGAVRFRCS